MIAIVLPYFQRTPGLLQRAVASILDQETACPWHLVVVDDGSPVDALEDLAPLQTRLAGRWTLLRQANAGVSAARNRALNHLTGEHDVVAFLDSDDCWRPGHLERIGKAFAAGADFYFANCPRLDGTEDRFERAALRAAECRPIDAGEQIYWFEGDFFDALLRGAPAATPTVAYRFCRAPEVRFRTDLSFCEDIFFWMEASKATSRIAFSPINSVICGRGVNISECGWGTSECARRTASLSRYHQLVQRDFALDAGQRQWNARALKGLDRDFWQSIFAAGVRGDYRCLPLIASYVCRRPQATALIPAALSHTLLDRFSRNTAVRE